MKPQEYRSKTNEELEKDLKELKMNMAISYGHHDTTKVRPEHRMNFRKEIAKIKTILRTREIEEEKNN